MSRSVTIRKICEGASNRDAGLNADAFEAGARTVDQGLLRGSSKKRGHQVGEPDEIQFVDYEFGTIERQNIAAFGADRLEVVGTVANDFERRTVGACNEVSKRRRGYFEGRTSRNSAGNLGPRTLPPHIVIRRPRRTGGLAARDSRRFLSRFLTTGDKPFLSSELKVS